uniref:Rhodanese domain-containing protein n=2 Tax=Ascaris TaxID=6251 RepID=A0A9J2PET7_ASCLU
MPAHERWFRTSPQPQLQKSPFTDIASAQKDYEDPDYYYSKPPELGQAMQKQQPPPLPPPMKIPQKTPPMSYSLKRKPQRKTRDLRVAFLGSLLTVVSFLLLVSVISLIVLTSKTQTTQSPTSEALLSNRKDAYSKDEEPRSGSSKSKADAMEVSPSYLLTLLITKRRVCVLEASTDNNEKSWDDFREEHIESARILFFGNLSRNAAPVHPLQFQRYVRSLGVDGDCHVILYDRGDMIWATYAFWIFTLFGHNKVSVLSGGFDEWKRLQAGSEQYRTESGPGAYVQRIGNFQAEWKSNVICTFDDVLTNTELKTYDLVDAQDKEEYSGIGTGAIFGHIRSAVNIPIDDVFNWRDQRWLNNSDLSRVLSDAGLHRQKPVIVYCSTSVRSSMIWFALRRCNYNATIYFGSWPEWLIRAPDFLKIIPERRRTL